MMYNPEKHLELRTRLETIQPGINIIFGIDGMGHKYDPTHKTFSIDREAPIDEASLRAIIEEQDNPVGMEALHLPVGTREEKVDERKISEKDRGDT